MAKLDPSLLAAMAACATHARSLFESAKAVQASGHPNIAYHLATVALEELGKRELLQLQAIAVTRADPPSWPAKATEDHVKKLFWCFFGLRATAYIADPEHFLQMRDTAAHMHATRLAGLYVDEVDQILQVPSERFRQSRGNDRSI
jgi:AbiV family abortive infection protein